MARTCDAVAGRWPFDLVACLKLPDGKHVRVGFSLFDEDNAHLVAKATLNGRPLLNDDTQYTDVREWHDHRNQPWFTLPAIKLTDFGHMWMEAVVNQSVPSTSANAVDVMMKGPSKPEQENRLPPSDSKPPTRKQLKAMQSAEEQKGKIATAASAPDERGQEQLYSVVAVTSMLTCSNGTLNKYAKAAHVKTPSCGERNFCYTKSEVVSILKHISKTASDSKLKSAADSALADLTQIAQ